MSAGGRTDTPMDVARGLHRRDPSADAFGIDLVEVSGTTATVEMTVADWMCNGLGTCHGGVVFTLADSAMAFASNCHGDTALAAAASIDLLAPVPPGAVLRATATERWLRGRTGIYDVEVALDDGMVVAVFRGRIRRMGERGVVDTSGDGAAT